MTSSDAGAAAACRQALAFQLGDLVGVARAERRVLVGRRVRDVAVHAHGAAVDDAPHAGPGGGLDEPPHRLRVHRAVRRLGQAGLPIEGRDVVDDVDAGHSGGERLAAGQVAGDHLHAGARQVGGARGLAHQRAHRVAARCEVHGQMPAGESGGAGDEDLHRSARIVTGEPASFSSPTDASARSTPVVRAREFSRLCTAIGNTNWRCSRVMRKPCAQELGADLPVGEHAIGLGARAEPVRQVARGRLNRRHAGRRRIVDDHPAARHAARLGHALTPVRRVHQHAQAHHRVERSDRRRRGDARRRSRTRSRIRGPRARASATRSISADASTAVTRAPASASTSAARPVPVPTSSTVAAAAGAGVVAQHVGLRRGQQLADGPAETRAVELIGHGRIGVDGVAVVVRRSGRPGSGAWLKPRLRWPAASRPARSGA